jgi:hypothetical protein
MVGSGKRHLFEAVERASDLILLGLDRRWLSLMISCPTYLGMQARHCVVTDVVPIHC